MAKCSTRIQDEALRGIIAELNEANEIDNEIAFTLARLQRLEHQVSQTPGAKIDCPELAAERDCLLNEYRLLRAAREQARDRILQIPNNRYRMLLEMRYLDGLTFYAIAARMNYSERQIQRDHVAALRLLLALRDRRCA